jgi:excisionase family DNA binding protein
VSSEAAARYCLVAPDTLARWIAGGHLPARRTAAGRFRIRAADLRAFMAGQGIRTDALDEDLGLSPACWEFWASLERTGACRGGGPSCAECPVSRAHAGVCHEVRPWQPGGTLRAPSCPDCLFFATVRGVEPDDV